MEFVEGKAKVIVEKNVFFNEAMEICRDFSSLVVGSLGNLNKVCDGMCGTGVRGIRYKLENENVGEVYFLDSSKDAYENTRKNLALNGLEKYVENVYLDDFNHFMYRGRIKFDFVEIDPFGSPVPFLRSALFNMRDKGGFISVTATDTAVLCGVHREACENNYLSKPLHNYFCHETGARILIGYIAKVAAPLHLGIRPIFVLSKRHFFKVLAEVKKGAKSANESLHNLGYIYWCRDCFDTNFSKDPFGERKCECGGKKDFAGQLWVGKIYDKEIIAKMKKENEKRNYKKKNEIRSIINIMMEEDDSIPYYFDLHEIFDKLQIPSVKFERIIENLKKKGYIVTRTHFNLNAIKTNAKSKEIFEILAS